VPPCGRHGLGKGIAGVLPKAKRPLIKALQKQPFLYQVAIKRVLFFDKGFAGYAGKTLINSSSPPLGRGQGEGDLMLH